MVLAGLSHERVGEHMWQMAHEGHQPIVFSWIDGNGPGANLVKKAEQQLQRGRLHVCARRQKVRRTLVK